MSSIAFIDAEIDVNSKRILDLGSVKSDGSRFHSSSVREFAEFINGVQYLCGHNIIRHDLPHLTKYFPATGDQKAAIDTLYLSPLLFPSKPYHALLKDDKLNYEDPNNPFNDAVKARDLFYEEVTTFNELGDKLKNIYHLLLHDKTEFRFFFSFVGFQAVHNDASLLIYQVLRDQICENAPVKDLAIQYPIELAYSVSLINSQSRYSITPPWVLKNFPSIDHVMKVMRDKPCLTGCAYCNKALNGRLALKRFFHFDQFRSYAGEPLQEKAVNAAIDGKSILAIFPTGGGKSLTFQLPALMAGQSCKALTVVISPLQSLMKDQVDNLERQGITDAVTINGLLDPIERAKSFERVADGSACMLYISPESLRSPTITHLLEGRKISRFVIDEAHCFSAWGQDFRVDYLYIGDFIKSLQERKRLTDPIPISCFTATAKQKVIEDIKEYFRTKNGLDLEVFSSEASRTNLTYKVLEKDSEEEKYSTLRDLIEERNCPTIVYVSRTHKAEKLAERLAGDGFSAKPYHGKMDVKEKTSNQDSFIRGDVNVMVATSAFGMGVDKKDVGMVIHYEISDSLENYVQEAGRAGRDEAISAECFVLFNDEDLSKHFILLNQTKLSIKEIGQVWKAIKDLTKFRNSMSNSALEIARKAGWDDGVVDIETRVTTAIAALEDAGYLRRGQNLPRVFATSILTKTAQEAIDKINSSPRFDQTEKEKAIRIIKKLIASKNRKQSESEVAESRVDYISDHLGIAKEGVIRIIGLLREERILADQKDLTAYIKKGENKNKSLAIVETFGKIEKALLEHLQEEEQTLNIKELNEQLEAEHCADVNPNKIKIVLNFWAIKNWIKRHNQDYSRNNIIAILNQPKPGLRSRMELRHQLAVFIVDFLYSRSSQFSEKTSEELIEFSVHELKEAYQRIGSLFDRTITMDDVEDALFFLSRIESIKIEGGFLVLYNRLRIERLEQNNKIQYKQDDFQKLNQFYENRVQQIHIVGEYAKRMLSDYKNALQFVNDYFQLNFPSFLNKYFPRHRQEEMSRNITPTKFRQLFGALSPTQLKIIKDSKSKYTLVAAGPGSGKTRVLVHKLASLALMEDVKTDQMLMVTFSRSAANDFKKKLLALIGNVANYIEIKTFHSYCFDLLGRVGTIEKSDEILKSAISKIRSGEVEQNRITKTVLVIDEAQDMDRDEFELINAMIEQNDEMRVIAVGDDDQNIYSFRKADAKYMQEMILGREGKLYELTENYRSAPNLVEFSNQFVTRIKKRIKTNPIFANKSQPGYLKVTRHSGDNLVIPVANDIAGTSLKGSTCVLTKTNEDASLIAGLLQKRGTRSRLIQSNDGFNLYNLLEVRMFLNELRLENSSMVISDEHWAQAKRQLASKLRSSSQLHVINGLIEGFEVSCGRRKFLSDLEVFIRESKLEDFYSENGETIFVSTIHKAKGREFDNVFLMLDHVTSFSDEELRPIYVALTRARNFLSIHTNGAEFNGMYCDGIIELTDQNVYPSPPELAIQLTLRDVMLDFYINRQQLYAGLVSGDSLIPKKDGCCNQKGDYLLKFSQKFKTQLEAMEASGYKLTEAKVNFILYWKKEGTETECRTILPELVLSKA